MLLKSNIIKLLYTFFGVYRVKQFETSLIRGNRKLGTWVIKGSILIGETYENLLDWFRDWLRVMQNIEIRPGDIVIVKESGLGASYVWNGNQWIILEVKLSEKED